MKGLLTSAVLPVQHSVDAAKKSLLERNGLCRCGRGNERFTERESCLGQCVLLCFKSCSVKMWSLWSFSQRVGYDGQYVLLCYKVAL